MEQTAVDWFYDKVIQKQYKDIDDSLEDLFEQAKEMEKQQQGYSESDLKQAYAYNNRLNSEQGFKDWFKLFNK